DGLRLRRRGGPLTGGQRLLRIASGGGPVRRRSLCLRAVAAGQLVVGGDVDQRPAFGSPVRADEFDGGRGSVPLADFFRAIRRLARIAGLPPAGRLGPGVFSVRRRPYLRRLLLAVRQPDAVGRGGGHSKI